MAADDGQTSIRVAKDYQPDDGQLAGEWRFIKFVRDEKVFDEDWQQLLRFVCMCTPHETTNIACAA